MATIWQKQANWSDKQSLIIVLILSFFTYAFSSFGILILLVDTFKTLDKIQKGPGTEFSQSISIQNNAQLLYSLASKYLDCLKKGTLKMSLIISVLAFI